MYIDNTKRLTHSTTEVIEMFFIRINFLKASYFLIT